MPINSINSSFSNYKDNKIISNSDNKNINIITGKRYIIKKLTENITDTYYKCNNNIKILNYKPQRILTIPSTCSSTNVNDNIDGNLIVKVHDEINCYLNSLDISIVKDNIKNDYKNNNNDKLLSSYLVIDLLGVGTFGQVFRCERTRYLSNNKTIKDYVALKIIKNIPSYHSQGVLECQIARVLNDTYDPLNQRHIVRLLDSFMFKGHVCLVFELLGSSLLDLLTQNQYRGLPLSIVQRIARQIIIALVTLQDANVIHCDLKPENILLVPKGYKNDVNVSSKSNIDKHRPSIDGIASLLSQNLQDSNNNINNNNNVSDVKVIDLGSACFEGKTMFSYIQSRFYRAPEILLGIPYNGAIDMWSFGCVCVELYLGLPLFPGVSQHNQLTRIIDMFGQPPDHLIEIGKNCNKYFYKLRQHNNETSSVYRIKTAEEYARDTKTDIPILKKYLRYNRFEDVIMKCPLPITSNASSNNNRIHWTSEQRQEEVTRRQSFLDFLNGIFQLDPFERWTAKQAASHPFITNSSPLILPHIPYPDSKKEERKLVYNTSSNLNKSKKTYNYNSKYNSKQSSVHSSNDRDSNKINSFIPLDHRNISDPVNDINVYTKSINSSNISMNLKTTNVLTNHFDGNEGRPVLKRGEAVIPVRSPDITSKDNYYNTMQQSYSYNYQQSIDQNAYNRHSTNFQYNNAYTNPYINHNDLNHNSTNNPYLGSNQYNMASSTGGSMQDHNLHLMSDFGQALLRPYMNENRHIQSKMYYSNSLNSNSHISPSSYHQISPNSQSFKNYHQQPSNAYSNSNHNLSYSNSYKPNQMYFGSPHSYTTSSNTNSYSSNHQSLHTQPYMIVGSNINSNPSSYSSVPHKMSQSYNQDNLDESPISSGKGFENILSNNNSLNDELDMNISIDDINNDSSITGAVADWDPFFSTDEDGVSTNESNRSNDSNITNVHVYSNSYQDRHVKPNYMQSHSLPNSKNKKDDDIYEYL